MSAAAQAQELRKEIERRPEVRAVYGPSLGKPGQFFMRYVIETGQSFAIELTEDSGDE